MKFATPGALAEKTQGALVAQGSKPPDRRTLVAVFETMYAASVHTEEGETISFHVVFMDPDNPDPDPPRNIRRHRWKVWAFDEALPYEVEELVKLAKATDPRTSSLAVFGRNGRIVIWGLVDQGTHYFDFMNLDSDTTQAHRPGMFQASIEGVAHVAAWIDFYKVAELRGSVMVGAPLDALRKGRIEEALKPAAKALLRRAKGYEGEPIKGATDGAHFESYRRISEAFRRILLRARAYRHGGAVLVLPEGADTSGLNIKYPMQYDRLGDALGYEMANSAMSGITQDVIFEHMDEEAESLPMMLYLDNSIADGELEDASREIDSVVWFIALLTRVDGLVLLDHDLCVKGFGVVIDVEQEPPTVVQAVTAPGGRVKDLDYTGFGTRHRSMMRACWEIKGSVGFVISQDGMVRAMTASESGVVVWRDLLLQRVEYEPRVPISTRVASRRSGTANTD
jgi:hypothetical protein